jgi:hypothetical protein
VICGCAAGIEQHSHVVDRAIHHAALDAYDELRFHALVVGRVGDVAGSGAVGSYGLKHGGPLRPASTARSCDRTDDPRSGYCTEHRWPALLSPLAFVAGAVLVASCAGRRGANPRLHLRAGEDRTPDRVVGDRESSAAPAELRSDDIRAVLQAGDETDDSPSRILFERAADIATVDVDVEVSGCRGLRHHDFDQGVAAADEIGAVATAP